MDSAASVTGNMKAQTRSIGGEAQFSNQAAIGSAAPVIDGDRALQTRNFGGGAQPLNQAAIDSAASVDRDTESETSDIDEDVELDEETKEIYAAFAEALGIPLAEFLPRPKHASRGRTRGEIILSGVANEAGTPTVVNPQPTNTPISVVQSCQQPLWPPKLTCSICGKFYSRKATIERHLYTHTGEKPFACDQDGCEYHANRGDSILKHKRGKHWIWTPREYIRFDGDGTPVKISAGVLPQSQLIGYDSDDDNDMGTTLDGLMTIAPTTTVPTINVPADNVSTNIVPTANAQTPVAQFNLAASFTSHAHEEETDNAPDMSADTSQLTWPTRRPDGPKVFHCKVAGCDKAYTRNWPCLQHYLNVHKLTEAQVKHIDPEVRLTRKDGTSTYSVASISGGQASVAGAPQATTVGATQPATPVLTRPAGVAANRPLRNEEKPFACPIAGCPNRFKLQGSIARHLRKKHGQEHGDNAAPGSLDLQLSAAAALAQMES